jgi:hypothetical protein
MSPMGAKLTTAAQPLRKLHRQDNNHRANPPDQPLAIDRGGPLMTGVNDANGMVI